MKPLIGIVPSINENERYYFTMEDNVEAIKRTGGIPVILPYVEGVTELTQLITSIDGLYLVGGNDVDPTYFGEEPHPQLGEVNPTRDAFELQILSQTLAQNKPILAICKGCQMINVVLGGTLYQDIHAQLNQTLVQHQQNSPHSYPTHKIVLEKKSQLHHIIKESSIKVNSRHHQAIHTLGKGLIVTSRTQDGVIESIESTAHDFVIGVQWHPENLLAANDGPSTELYTTFIKKCMEIRSMEKE